MKDNEKKCGVYFLYLNKQVVYIGKSTNLEYRINLHIRKRIIEFDFYSFIILKKTEISFEEVKYIKQFNPPLNIMYTDKIHDVRKRTILAIRSIRSKRDKRDRIENDVIFNYDRSHQLSMAIKRYKRRKTLQ